MNFLYNFGHNLGHNPMICKLGQSCELCEEWVDPGWGFYEDKKTYHFSCYEDKGKGKPDKESLYD